MSAISEAYERARDFGKEAETDAKKTVTRMSVDELRSEWVSLIGMLGYYTKLEALVQQNPRQYFDKIRELLKNIQKNPDDWESIKRLIEVNEFMVDPE